MVSYKHFFFLLVCTKYFLSANPSPSEGQTKLIYFLINSYSQRCSQSGCHSYSDQQRLKYQASLEGGETFCTSTYSNQGQQVHLILPTPSLIIGSYKEAEIVAAGCQIDSATPTSIFFPQARRDKQLLFKAMLKRGNHLLFQYRKRSCSPSSIVQLHDGTSVSTFAVPLLLIRLPNGSFIFTADLKSCNQRMDIMVGQFVESQT